MGTVRQVLQQKDSRGREDIWEESEQQV